MNIFSSPEGRPRPVSKMWGGQKQVQRAKLKRKKRGRTFLLWRKGEGERGLLAAQEEGGLG